MNFEKQLTMGSNQRARPSRAIGFNRCIFQTKCCARLASSASAALVVVVVDVVVVEVVVCVGAV